MPDCCRRTPTPAVLPVERKYASEAKAAAYRDRRRQSRHRREWRCVAALLPGAPAPGARALDVPAGAGRFRPLLEGAGWRVVEADRARAMLAAGSGVPSSEFRGEGEPSGEPVVFPHFAPCRVQADAWRTPFPAAHFDLIVCLRFFHHLSDDPSASSGQASARRALLAEFARIGRGELLLSFFHPLSLHALARRWAALCGRPPVRHAIGLGRLRELAAATGWRFVAARGEARYRRDFWVARFQRALLP